MKKSREKFMDLVVYQVYVRSFYDANGDGIGDLNGVTAKLNYLCDLGVNTIWLCPCYKSLNFDNGYDVSDYRDIMDDFGTFADWKRLIGAVHGRGMKLMMDLVVNHTSVEHVWFKEARKSRDNPYHDYYIWAEKPLNDWKSIFGGSAWEYNAATDEYYLHSFAIQQPDLNWENPKVRKECCDIVDFWAEQGVDGFRCDVLDFIAKDFKNGKMLNGPKLHEYIKELFGREKVAGLFTVGECQADENSIRELCGEGRDELKCSFQFEHFEVGRSDKYTPAPHSVADVAKILKKWQEFSQKHDFLYTLLTDNHDQPWFNSRVGNDGAKRYESATLIATMVYALRGIPFIYQGQETGAANSVFEEITAFNDVETLNYYHENAGKLAKAELMRKINYGSRDNTRRPMAWNGGKGYGFTTADKPWLAYATRSGGINAESDLKSEKSVIRYYRQLLALRKKYKAFRYGAFQDRTRGAGYFAYERTYGKEKFAVVCNFEQETLVRGLEARGKTVLSNYVYAGEELNRVYRPFETAIYKL